MADNKEKRRIEIPPKDPFYFVDNELLYFRWSNVFWASMFMGHQSEPNSIPYWILGVIGLTSSLVSFYYLYKWFRE
jgi:hypothetical protein